MTATSREVALLGMAVALGLGCDQKKDVRKDDAGKAERADERPAAPAPPPIEHGDEAPKTVYAYPPKGPGPHEGFDLAAIRDKLQGAWLVGGSAFSSIPTVWSLRGDTLVQVDEQGKRTESVLRLLAPCYFSEGPADGHSATFGHFAFDGDTLYLGLGNAGVVQGDKTIGCMSVAMYVYENGACTAWTKKPFAKEGDLWEREEGDCGYTEDKSVFYGDDTHSKRKIYGRQELHVHGPVLLTRQMEGNKAVKLDSLEAALAEQKKRIEAKEALKRTPTDLPFASWGVESVQPELEKGAPVWAAAVSRDGHWSLGAFRYEKFEQSAVWVRSGWDAWAPSAFVHVPGAVAEMKKGAPALLAIGALMPYGRFVKMDGDKAVFAYESARQVRERTLEVARVLPFAPKEWVFGAPLAMRKEGRWTDARLVLDAGSFAYVLAGDGVEKWAKADLKLIDTSRRWAKGDKVWAMQSSGISPLQFVAGKVVEIHGDGVFFTIETEDGRKLDQSFARLVESL